MHKDDAIRLRHMLDAAQEAIEFAQGHTRAHLDGDRKLVLALVKDIEIIGEAAYQVSPTTRRQLPGIPWDDIIGMRHRLIHGYDFVDYDILWDTITYNLPGLIALLDEILGDGA